MKRYLKWAGLAVGSIVILLVLLIVVLSGIGGMRVNSTYDIQLAAVNVPTDAVSIEQGKHFIEAIGLCQECHGDNLEGSVLEDDPVFGRLVPTNLTSGKGGIGGVYTDQDFVRAIRHGIGHDGKGLVVMPSEAYNKLSDEDLGAVIAYLKSIPPIDNELQETRLGIIGRIVNLLDPALIPAQSIDHTAPRSPSPERGVTIEYGEYMATVCTVCHGENLGGAMLPDDSNAFAPNLTPGGALGVWTEADFISTLRTGVTPGGNTLDEENMPWDHFRLMTDDELKAIWLYLSSLPPR